MTPTYQLYALIDPITNEIKYIGLTTRPLHRRLESHLGDKRRDNQRQLWVHSLLKQNLKPEIQLLATFTSREEAVQEETRTITYFRHKGNNLTNSLKGGALGHTYQGDTESKPITCNGVTYRSSREAADATGIPRGSIMRSLNTGKPIKKYNNIKFSYYNNTTSC